MVLVVKKSDNLPSYMYPAQYAQYPEFLARLRVIKQAHDTVSDAIHLSVELVMESPHSSPDAKSAALAEYNAACKTADDERKEAIDQAHQDLNVPYLVDCQAAIQATGQAVFHNEIPLWDGYISDVRSASVRVLDNSDDQVEIIVHRVTVMKRSDLPGFGFGGPLQVMEMLTWEAIEYPESLEVSYWKKAVDACQRKIDEGVYADSCVKAANAGLNDPFCCVYKRNDGNYDLISASFSSFNNLDERGVNEKLKDYNVPLIGWE